MVEGFGNNAPERGPCRGATGVSHGVPEQARSSRDEMVAAGGHATGVTRETWGTIDGDELKLSGHRYVEQTA
ncbi:hypothetical protein Cob_v010138 [Colletotrichum orbiculare MAFF 240422]|uniref:Uncharacterized protein n=1 Tax=Colletotrichum orbiculare (strain 104-T / ATCC 96160 / CBS 514.97 / LARS 414 / MAFF 240422) TaxID=1213857 RepID=A0A484FH67_COLOR|nr:hypothetical protein Cob_v010138 [Colletotrichum orbiculare MAFF 240422]